MVLLKSLDNNKTNHPTVTVELDYNAVCDIHNCLCEASKSKEFCEEIALDFTNIFEMLKHGRVTDFGIYQNAKYFKKHDDFSNWGDTNE